ncbi:Fur family transcriptional regulator [Phyllobacterium sp. 22229]|uniref:Ferric uptake regulation protein n=1 Tax=Phyllobacterium myrsinacearum TaxID=28101 RepID=A0A2S9JWD9_9HYPH|nr:Fur family transcriptional regulator [Phyllobacterium myrsinacearum]PRD57669.1 transcriptional repressor [Phyllobacterium myrsinacearum]PWV87270.1 Fur family zinc uptake transcriptional regulator [Phyllobacterium myrsinacearum]RZS83097.1 Fur family zinc uptake transcriptional regulator [Phyllobacterium myrsinacearum]RZV10191.1 Fur family zinc uptake transcriptional regulator [Phyllobacterium myrsinacearum]
MTTAHELTKNQALVFNTLSRAEGPLSAYTILDQLRGDGFRAPLQVYRALEKLLDYGMVHRLESINAFVACAHPHNHSHNHGMIAFAICEKCGQVSEFSDDVITQRVREWTSQNGFKQTKTTIEIRGVCAACGTA